MIKLFKFFKNKLLLLFTIILFFLQAYCDLTLPFVTSEIVNIGIQKNGIKNTYPEYISKDFYSTITQIPNNKLILDKYYTLKNMSKNDLFNEKIDVYTLNKNLDENATYEIKNVFSNFADNILKQQFKNTNNLPDSAKEQIITEIIKKDYTTMGINLETIQNNFMKESAIKMLILAFIGSSCFIIVTYLSSFLSANMGANIRKAIYSKILKFSNNEYSKYATSSLITRTTNDVTQVQNSVMMILRIVIYAPILFIGGLIKILNTDYHLISIVIFAIISIIILISILFGFALPKFKKMQKLTDRLNLVSREMLNGLNVIRAFNKQSFEHNRFIKANNELYSNNKSTFYLVFSIFPLVSFIMNVTLIAIVYKSAKYIDLGYINIGDVLAFMQYAMQMIMSFIMISMIFSFLPRANVSASRINEILNETISISDNDNIILENIEKIEFKNVSLSLNGEKNILSNINFILNKGDSLAIIGTIGSGKTTILNLLLRFNDVTSGEILINDINIKKYNLKSLRDKISLIAQKNTLFSETISNNIKFGNLNANFDDIIKVTKLSSSFDFINEKENKFNTLISKSSDNLSGGQKQRLSIARGLIRNPDLYLFDDTFSALDYKTDYNIRKALKEPLSNAISIIVAQRISTISNSDYIMVLDNGNIVDFGNHEYLLNNCKLYKDIANSQMKRGGIIEE